MLLATQRRMLHLARIIIFASIARKRGISNLTIHHPAPYSPSRQFITSFPLPPTHFNPTTFNHLYLVVFLLFMPTSFVLISIDFIKVLVFHSTINYANFLGFTLIASYRWVFLGAINFRQLQHNNLGNQEEIIEPQLNGSELC